ncbi:MAG: hypothetical protein K8F91_25145, partial [Candidatus Obscuribacterales bacterium]|nr:hypothetical protein [Candidatus Obscuribacterales bacterium]
DPKAVDVLKETGFIGQDGIMPTVESAREFLFEHETEQLIDKNVKELAFSIKEGSLENINQAVQEMSEIRDKIAGTDLKAAVDEIMAEKLNDAINDPKIKVKVSVNSAVQLEIDNQRLGTRIQFGDGTTRPALVVKGEDNSTKRLGPQDGAQYKESMDASIADMKSPSMQAMDTATLDNAFQRSPQTMLDKAMEVAKLGIRTPSTLSDCLIEQSGFAKTLLAKPELLAEKMQALLAGENPQRALEILEQSGVRHHLFPQGDFSSPEKARETLNTFMEKGPSRGNLIAAEVAQQLSNQTKVHNGEGVGIALSQLAEKIDSSNPRSATDFNRIGQEL